MAENNCMTPQGFNENSRLRASDADRDAAASVVNNALAEGRLTAEEHSDRLDAIYAAKTQAELVPLLEDLPGSGAPVPRPAGGEVANVGRSGRIIAIFSGHSRRGGWHAEPVMDVTAVFGGVDLDFREAVLPGQEVVLRATAILGGIDVIVPPEMRVVDGGGLAILGGRDIAGTSVESSGPDAPVLRIEGTCVLGAIDVKRKSRRRKGSKTGNRLRAGAPGDFGAGAIMDQFRGHHHDVHRLIREQRRQVNEQIRQQRRELRRNWGGGADWAGGPDWAGDDDWTGGDDDE
jgi:Domain of unknown function (DUF1707)/Cell wall-active antibiotics response 4TMS YvqF